MSLRSRVLRVGKGINGLTPGSGSGSCAPTRLQGTNIKTILMFKRLFGILPLDVTGESLSVTGAATSTAGVSYIFTVTAKNAAGSTNTGYFGTVQFTNGDQQSSLPLSATLTAGVGIFTMVPFATGSQTITATDASMPSISGTLSSTVTGTNKYITSTWDNATAGLQNGSLYIGTSTDGFSWTFTSQTYTIPNINNTVFRDHQLPFLYGKPYVLSDSGNTGTSTNFFWLTSTDDLVNTNQVGSGQIVLPTMAGVIDPKLRLQDDGTPLLFYLGNTDANFNHNLPYYEPMVFPFDFQQFGAPVALTTDGTFSWTLGASDIGVIHPRGGLWYLSLSGNGMPNAPTIYVSSSPSGPYSLLQSAANMVGVQGSTISPIVNFAGNQWYWFADPSGAGPFGYQIQTKGPSDWESGIAPSGSNTFGVQVPITRSGTTAFVSPSVSVYASLAPNLQPVRFYMRNQGVTSGVNCTATFTALDQYNHLAGSYTGTVKFQSTDTGATLPANSTLARGVGIFSLTLVGVGNQTLTVSDSVTSTIASSIPVQVQAAFTTYKFSLPATAVAGTGFPFTITAGDASGNIDIDYNGTVTFSTSDNSGYAKLPANHALAAGVGIFSATLNASGNRTITGTDSASTITGTSGNVNVSALTFSKFALTAPASATSGVSINMTVYSTDAYNNTVSSYTGTVSFSSGDAFAALPASNTLTSGSGVFPMKYGKSGNQKTTATDVATGTITGVSNSTTVTFGTTTHYNMTGWPTVATAGTQVTGFVVSQDFGNNTATGYTGTVHLTCGDGQAVIGADNTLASGTRKFSVTLKTSGSQTVTATDKTTSSITGSTPAIVVSALTTSKFAVTSASTTTAGNVIVVTVTAQDAFGNLTTGYSGTVTFSASDTQATMPANGVLTAGVGVFSATLATSPTQTISATDTVTSSITGKTSGITVAAASPQSLVLTAPLAETAGVGTAATATAKDVYSNTCTNYSTTIRAWTGTDNGASTILPVQGSMVNGVYSPSMTLTTSGTQTLTATDNNAPTLTGSIGGIVVTAAAGTHYLVNAPATASHLSLFAFTVTAEDPFNNTATGYTGTVTFTASAIVKTLPANSTLAAGIGNFSATLVSVGTQTLTATDTVTGSIVGTAVITIS